MHLLVTRSNLTKYLLLPVRILICVKIQTNLFWILEKKRCLVWCLLCKRSPLLSNRSLWKFLIEQLFYGFVLVKANPDRAAKSLSYPVDSVLVKDAVSMEEIIIPESGFPVFVWLSLRGGSRRGFVRVYVSLLITVYFFYYGW